ncbi:MAG: hypothetical protein IJR26_06690 [Bacteroidales bacterium]|nr:hypothetical protein [Bacteroidales bacterium]
MKRPFNKKRFWLIIAILALVEALVCYIAIQWKYIFPSNEVSEIYARYEKVEGIDVSFVKDYKVNDTVFVDVTLLEATDSVGWATLKKDFEIPNPSPDFQQRIDSGKNMIGVKIIPKSIAVDTTSKEYPNNLLAISYLNHTLTIFHIKNDVEKHAVKYHNFDKSTNQ